MSGQTANSLLASVKHSDAPFVLSPSLAGSRQRMVPAYFPAVRLGDECAILHRRRAHVFGLGMGRSGEVRMAHTVTRVGIGSFFFHTFSLKYFWIACNWLWMTCKLV